MSANVYIIHCVHGLDLRIYPRCFLCKPLGSDENAVGAIPTAGCQCPRFWWGILPPPCPLHNPSPPTTTITVGPTAHCNCPPDRGDNYAGNCPIHDVQTTYTVVPS